MHISDKSRNLYLINFSLKIYKKLNFKLKLSFAVLFFLMIICSVLESFTLYAIIPVLTVLTNKGDTTLEGNIIYDFLSKIGIGNDYSLIFFLIFIFLILGTNIARIITLYLLTNLSARIGTFVSTNVFSKILYDDFEETLKRSSSNVINTLERKSRAVVLFVNSILQIMTSSFLIIFVFLTLFFINYQLTFSLVGSLLFIYIFIASFLNKKLINNGKLASYANQKQIKQAQDGLGSVRNIILNNSYKYFVKQYNLKDSSMRLREGENLFLNLAPRYFVEGISLAIIFLIILNFRENFESQGILPVVGAFALGSQRIIPMFQIVYSSFAAISSYKIDVESMINYLNKNIDINYKKIIEKEFKNNIFLENISFKYAGSPSESLKKVSLKINKGDRIGIMGKTGSGKTTLVDIICGLLRPNKGKLYVDKVLINSENIKSFQKTISYIPQNTFLIEGSIIENIAFGIQRCNVDMTKIKKAAEFASIYEYIESLPNKYDTYIGERGVTLSGGQAQRISIARALYRNSSILILDESTSSLDMNTESEITNSLEKISKDITIIIIAHRPSTLNICNKIIEMNNGSILNNKDFE